MFSKYDDVRCAGTASARSRGCSYRTSRSRPDCRKDIGRGSRTAGVLRCGAAVAPPYIMRDPATGEYSGFYADLCKEFADALKVKAEFVDTTWDNIVAGLQAGKWDMSLALNRTPARAMAVQFSIPAMEYQISLAYNKTTRRSRRAPLRSPISTRPDVTIAVMSGTAQDKAISAASRTRRSCACLATTKRASREFQARRYPGRRFGHKPASHAIQPGLGGGAQSRRLRLPSRAFRSACRISCRPPM
jgi:membrane-bound lytic murein transglycosylase MltF